MKASITKTMTLMSQGSQTISDWLILTPTDIAELRQSPRAAQIRRCE
jgi:hypothetical protein